MNDCYEDRLNDKISEYGIVPYFGFGKIKPRIHINPKIDLPSILHNTYIPSTELALEVVFVDYIGSFISISVSSDNYNMYAMIKPCICIRISYTPSFLYIFHVSLIHMEELHNIYFKNINYMSEESIVMNIFDIIKSDNCNNRTLESIGFK